MLGFLRLLLLVACLAALPVQATELKRAEPAERQELAVRYAKALQTELGLLQALDAIDQHAGEVDEQIVRLSVDMAAATDALHAAEKARAEAQNQLETMRVSVQARLRAILRLAQLPTLRFALSHQDFATSVAKDRLLRRLLVRDKERLDGYRKELNDLARLTAERDAGLQKLTDLEQKLHAEKARAEQERRDKLALVAEIDADRKYHERIGRDLDIANRQLTERIEALQEWSERKYTFAMLQGKLLAPVSGRIDVPYGEIRNARFGTVTLHRGLDYRPAGGAPGQTVRAVFWGKVAHIGWLTGYGQTVILDHGHGWHTVYAHLENIKVELGEVVKSRQRMAEVGQSGSLKGRYLYFEIRHNGQTVDPAEWVH